MILRKLISLALAFSAAIALSGCAPASQADLVNSLQPICKPFTTGHAMDDLKATTDFREQPATSFTPGLTSSQIETKIIHEGSGPKLVGNQLIYMEYEGLNGGTGKAFQSTKHNGTDTVIQFLKKDSEPDFCHALTGVRVGSRVAILFPAKIAHGGKGVPSIQVGPNDSLVFVIDVLSAALPHAMGTPGQLVSGFPAISIDPKTGTPGFTFAGSTAPAKFASEKLIVGNGQTVKDGDVVTVNYSGIVYGASEVFDSSWANGQPAQFQTNGVIPGFTKALVGSKVGDRIVVIIPPDLGYGNATQGAIPPNSTLVFVIEILDTKH